MGCNTVRVYAAPPRWFLDACAAAGVYALVGWPWPSHTDFLRTRRGRREILAGVGGLVRGLRGAPSVLGYLVGNEVPAELVRWMGPERVQRFLERMIEVGRHQDPDALFAYASFPSTEYLNPRNADFVVSNIYLEERSAFTRYLARLQHVAGDRPLVVGEFGLDTRRHGESRQADTLAWAWGACLRAGLAGQVIFGFTDEWSNHGRRMDPEWCFGVTAADRRPKEAVAALGALLPPLRRAGQGVRLRQLPRISIIICTFNGSRTLRTALDSVQNLPYPDYEVLLVDDGSADPSVATIAADYREVRTFRISHGGLSRARNFGASQSSGSILVYLDDDAAAATDWLTYLALAFEDERVGAAGGPNIPPPPVGWKAAGIAVAPGGPAVVMLNDTDAEHIPGCNLAVTRAAWEAVGGFDDRHRSAGDDVDFCWRLIEHGYKIAYQPGAMVWHERRQSVRAYFRQQTGYGRAEAALIGQHPHRFAKLGGARWRGVVYDQTARTAAVRGIVYGGMFGTAPYQFLYALPTSPVAAITSGAPWVLAAILALLGAPWVSALAAVGVLMLVPPVWTAARLAASAPIARWPGRNRLSAAAARALVGVLAFTQPVARGFVREVGCLKQRRLPAASWQFWPLVSRARTRGRKAVAELALWNDHGPDRTAVLGALLDELRQAKWPVLLGGEWDAWDLEATNDRWWSVRVVTASEYHPPDGRLIRLRLHTRASRWTLAIALVSGLIVPVLFALQPAWGLWALAGTFLVWLGLEHLHGAAAARILRLALATARRLGFIVIDESRPKKPAG